MLCKDCNINETLLNLRRCKNCLNHYRYTKPKKVVSEKKCSICKIVLPISNFYECNYNTDGYEYRCKTCVNMIKREKYRENSFKKAVIYECN